MRRGISSCILLLALCLSAHAESKATGRSNTGSLFDGKRPAVPEEPGGLPPRLEFEMRFTEGSGNNFLDAEESGALQLVIHNRGGGPASEVTARLSALGPVQGVTHDEEVRLGGIPVGDSREVLFNISADIDVTRQDLRFLVQVLEANGYDADSAQLSFSTRSLRLPSLALAQFAVDDDKEGLSYGNNNGRVELGESVEVTAAIQNGGRGPAQQVEVEVSFPGRNANLSLLNDEYRFALGDIEAGGYRTLTFALSPNKRFQPGSIPIHLRIAERRPRFHAEAGIDLKLNIVQQRPAEMVIVGTEAGGTAADIMLVSDVDRIPSTGTRNPDAVAVIIGIAEYDNPDVPPVDFALRDAATFKDYLTGVFGYREANIIFVENARKSDFDGIFGVRGDFHGRLYNMLREGSEVFVYYSGHGAPDPDRQQGFFVPSDVSPSLVKLQGYPLQLFYDNLAGICREKKTGGVTVVIDACFSGGSEGGSLLGAVSPVFIQVDNPVVPDERFTVFTSSTGDQVSTWFTEQKHSLFTYFFLKGLKGEADADGDGGITVQELDDYLEEYVPYTARSLRNRVQTPCVISRDKQRVLLRLGK